MTIWDFLKEIFPPVAITITIIVAAFVLLIGFFQHGINFFKHGSANAKKQSPCNEALADVVKRIDRIENNHFGHLKNYLTLLTSVLLKNELIDEEMKAHMENELRNM
jgi:flagellar basal body-associated protein FliL